MDCFIGPLTLYAAGKSARVFSIDRVHMGFSVIDCYDRTVLLLRNYKGCITRHHGYEQIAEMGCQAF